MTDIKKCPSCGRALCQLCGEHHAQLVMKNKLNGNRLEVCKGCHKEVWASSCPIPRIKGNS